MSWIEGLIALTLAAIGTALLPIAFRLRCSVKQTQAKFRLYAARDRLYVAAAEGWISPNSKLFKVLRSGVVAFIREAEMLGFGQFAQLVDDTPRDVKRTREFLQMMQAVSVEGRRECLHVLIDSHDALLT